MAKTSRRDYEEASPTGLLHMLCTAAGLV